MTDKRFIAFCNERAKVLAEYGNASHYINVVARIDKKQAAWLEFVGLIETAHLIWYHEYTNNLDD